MAKKPGTTDRRSLRAEAEARFARSPPAAASTPPAADAVHELQVHQIELEMQNEELRAAHLELETVRDRYLDLYDFAPVGYVTLSVEGVILEANLATASLLGVDRGKLRGRALSAHVGAGDVDRFTQVVRGLGRPGGRGDCTLELRCADGSTLHAGLVLESRRRGEGPPEIRVAIKDVSEWVRADEELRLRESLLTAILNGTADGILVVGSSGKVLRANRRFLELWRIPPAVAASGDDDTLLGFVLDQLADREAFLREVRRLYDSAESSFDSVPLADGRCFERYSSPFRFDGPHGRLWSFRDVTDRNRLEAQLAVTSRLAAMGTLLGGIAHEINNPLAATMSSIDVALGDARVMGLHEMVECLSDARSGADRIAAIIRKLLRFGRPEPGAGPVRLAAVVEAAVRWIPSGLAGRATLEIEASPDVHVNGPAEQLQLLVSNLLTNAMQAIPPGRVGTVRVRVARVGNGLVRVEVVDDGVGMTPAEQGRAFDPFFTTREVGQGMGLGLSICHAIALASAGTLTVESEPGRGATFRLELPEAAVGR
ncbi:MAG: ATP-binding protein [Anaeromyxobacteraceae bacterium]